MKPPTNFTTPDNEGHRGLGGRVPMDKIKGVKLFHPDSDDSMVSGERRANVKKVCICGSEQCAQRSAGLNWAGDVRGELIKIPDPVKAISAKTKQTRQQRLERAMRSKARDQLFVHVLGRKPREGEGGRISLAHFHPSVLSAIGYKAGGKFPWKAEVPLSVLKALEKEGFTYDAANRVERLDVNSPPLLHKPYVPVPNIPILHDMHELWEREADIRRLHSMGGVTFFCSCAIAISKHQTDDRRARMGRIRGAKCRDIG